MQDSPTTQPNNSLEVGVSVQNSPTAQPTKSIKVGVSVLDSSTAQPTSSIEAHCLRLGHSGSHRAPAIFEDMISG